MPTDDRHFVAFVSDGANIWINLNLVRRITLDDNDGCMLWFSETDSMRIQGSGAMAILDRVNDRSIAANGEAMPQNVLSSLMKAEETP